MWKFRKKKQDNRIYLMDGLYLKPQRTNGRQLFYHGCLRSLIVFCIVFGSVGGFLSAFELPFSMLAVAFFYLLLSVYASLLYTAPKVYYRDIGYVVFFVLFLGMIYLLRDLANSGLYEVVNAVLRLAETFFDLPGVREYQVRIDNPFLTVTVLAVFAGMLEILVLNIWIYVTMGIGWTLMISFPLLLIPLYMKRTPDLFFSFVLTGGYLSVLFFKANGHFASYPADNGIPMRKFQKKMPGYTQDRQSFAAVFVTAVLICAMTAVLLSGLTTPTRFEHRFRRDELRSRSSETIVNFLMLGFAGLFNWYDATGGMSGGKLGGVARIRPDNQVDLYVTCVSCGGDAVYLKAFTGGRYAGNEWQDLYEHEGKRDERDADVFAAESLRAEAEALKDAYEDGAPDGACGRMDIKNVGADEHYLYYPYYTLMDDDTIYDRYDMILPEGISLWEEARYRYYPKQNWRGLGESRPSEMDLTQIDPVFLDVPAQNQDVLAAECARIGLTADMSENQIAREIASYFDENIPYTLRPGATPQGEDFVNYFLTKNRRGYCAHFASAATLIFRQMGIPARYVEGYVFTEENATESVGEYRYEDYYDGYLPGGETVVREYGVTDAMAHAWVEIYVPDFGWRVVEVTPGNVDAEESEGLWYAIANAFNERDMGTAGDAVGGKLFRAFTMSGLAWLLYPALLFLAALIVLRIGQLTVRKLRRYARRHQKNEREALIACYEQLCEMERICDPGFDRYRSHREQLLRYRRNYGLPTEPKQVCAILEEASFSRHVLPPEALYETYTELRGLRKAIGRNADMRTKVRLLLR